MYIVVDLCCYEILDSRGFPTVEVCIVIEDLNTGGQFSTSAAAPSGASCGRREAVELRDKDQSRYLGKGVLILHSKISEILNILHGNQRHAKLKFNGIADFDKFLVDLDGTEQKTNLGGNLLIATSVAFAKAIAKARGIELWEAVRLDICEAELWGDCQSSQFQDWRMRFANDENVTARLLMPRLMLNILNGGMHADNKLQLQEFLICPNSTDIHDDLRIGSEVFQQLRRVLRGDGYNVNVGDEGGLAPNIKSHEEALDYIVTTLKNLKNYSNLVDISIDAAASEFFYNNSYAIDDVLRHQSGASARSLKYKELAQYYLDLIEKYRILSIEDPFDQDCEEHWHYFAELTKKSKFLSTEEIKTIDLSNRKQIFDAFFTVGDDLTTTNAARIEQVAKDGLISGVIIKPNQIGTLTEALRAVDIAKYLQLRTIVSHRSGETEDVWIADFALAIQSDFLKAGSVCRSDRVAKYNRLLRIDERQKRKLDSNRRCIA